MEAPVEKKKNKGGRPRKVKYDPKWHPLVVKLYLQIGKSLEYACDQLGITYDMFMKWRKEYPEFKKAVKDGKKPVDSAVINALYKCAVGYEYEEITYQNKVLTAEEQEKRAKLKNPPPIPQVPVKKTIKHVYPNTIAQIFWLKNRQPDTWKDKHDMDVNGKIEYKITDYTDLENTNNEKKNI